MSEARAGLRWYTADTWVCLCKPAAGSYSVAHTLTQGKPVWQLICSLNDMVTHRSYFLNTMLVKRNLFVKQGPVIENGTQSSYTKIQNFFLITVLVADDN